MMEVLALRSGGGDASMVVTVRAIVAVLAALVIIICGSRLYVRKFITKSFGIDDYMVIVAMFWVLAFAAFSIIITFYGLGRQQADVSNADLEIFLKIYYVAIATYLVVASSVKTSLMVFLMRNFPQKYIQWTGWGLIAFLAVFAISGSLATILQCNPINAFWDKALPNYTCFSANTLFGILMYQGVLMFITDVIIITLPMPIIWKLQMPLKKRLMVLGLFSFGFVACIAALVRFTTLVYTKHSTNLTYQGATSLIWMNVEYSLGLISGSISSLRVLFRIKSIFSNKDDSRNMSNDGGLGKAYELGSRNKFGTSGSKSGWKGGGILKTSEVTVHGESRNESQERIVSAV